MIRLLITPIAAIAAWLVVAGAVRPSQAIAAPSSDAVELGQYRPTPFSARLLRLDRTEVAPFGHYRVGLDVDYAHRPLVLRDLAPVILQPGASRPEEALVRHAMGGSVLASFGLGYRLEAGLLLPIAIQMGDDVPGATSPALVGAGNPRLALKARLLEVAGFGVGATVTAALPGGLGALTHEGGFGGEARVIVDYRRDRFAAGVRGGFRVRPRTTFHDVVLGNELTFAAGVSADLLRRTTVLAEVAGATAVAHPFAHRSQSPLEALAGVRQRFGQTWLTLAGGPGLIDGYGSPAFRVVAGLTWANFPPDADRDGIPDDQDACPDVAEDRDGFQDGDGCPEADNDKDGLLDGADRCPNEAEDKDGFEDGDGCPDPDNDKDGVLDTADRCPTEPETRNDFEDEDGCPDEKPAADKDGDGIVDDKDVCPEDPEDKDGFEDEDGCPDPDNDKDGVLDAMDKCPLDPETINGVADDDGCPDKGESQVRLGKREIETLRPIYFDTDRARVRHAFHNILGQVAALLKAHPEIGRCAVEGHTDATGPDDWNEKLSNRRAQSVVEFLVKKGIDRNRLTAIGRSDALPWESNETPEGRARNRRVVFHIEGVDVEEQRKQRIRDERRRRIRKAREAGEADGNSASERTEGAPKLPKALHESGSGSAEQAPASGGSPPRRPGSAAPARAGSAQDSEAGIKAPGRDSAASSPVAPARAPTPGEHRETARPEAPPPDATRPEGPARPSRARAPRRPDGANAEPPQTLEELLKLPPR